MTSLLALLAGMVAAVGAAAICLRLAEIGGAPRLVAAVVIGVAALVVIHRTDTG